MERVLSLSWILIIFGFLVLSTSQEANGDDDALLLQLLNQVADKNKNVMIAETNSGFLDLTINFLGHLRKCVPPIENVLLFPLDKKARDNLKDRVVTYFPSEKIAKKKFTELAQRYRTNRYNQIVKYKWELVSLVLKAGFNILLSDVDVVWVRNPFSPKSYGSIYHYPECDVLFYCNRFEFENMTSCHHHTINTGVIYFRANERTEQVVEKFLQFEYPNDQEDQAGFNKFLSEITHGVIKPDLKKEEQHFRPSIPYNQTTNTCGRKGWITYGGWNRTQIAHPKQMKRFSSEPKDMTAIHFNYLPTLLAKTQMMKKMRLWHASNPKPHQLRGKMKK